MSIREPAGLHQRVECRLSDPRFVPRDIAIMTAEQFRFRWLLRIECWMIVAASAIILRAQPPVASDSVGKPSYVYSVDEQGRKNGAFVIPKSRQFIAERLAAINKMAVR